MSYASDSTTSGVYVITCTVNGKIYIGSSSNCKHRWERHKRDLRGSRHHSVYLQRAWNCHGEQSFIFTVLEECDKTVLFEREQYWLDTLQPFDSKGYNTSRKAAAPVGGHKHTPISRAKIGAANRGKKRTPEMRAHMSKVKRGIKRDPEAVRKSADALRGRKQTPEHIAKVVAVHLGSKRSPETCRRIGDSHSKSYIVIMPNGIEIEVTNLKQFCQTNNLSYWQMSKVANGKRRQYKGWGCRHQKDAAK